MQPAGRQLPILGITNQIAHYSFKSFLLTFNKDVRLKNISSFHVLVILMTHRLKTTNLDPYIISNRLSVRFKING